MDTAASMSAFWSETPAWFPVRVTRPAISSPRHDDVPSPMTTGLLARVAYSAPTTVVLQKRSTTPLLKLTAPTTIAPSASRELPVWILMAPITVQPGGIKTDCPPLTTSEPTKLHTVFWLKVTVSVPATKLKV